MQSELASLDKELQLLRRRAGAPASSPARRMELEKDLEAYDDVSVDDAREARDLLLEWIKADATETTES